MSTCFVIQPFDRGPFDKRYEDVIGPAIKAAGLEPYRVDRDPSVSIPIDQIENGIRAARVCLADITSDNPNVWFEVGFAIAAYKEVVLVASSTRTRFPFDVQHRNVLTYDTDSTSDFARLGDSIAKRLKAILTKEVTVSTAAAVASPVAPVEGLVAHEFVGLVAIGQNVVSPDEAVAGYLVRQDMERAGFTAIATTVALAGLLGKKLVSLHEGTDSFGQESYPTYKITELGFAWLFQNQAKLELRQRPKIQASDFQPADEDVPF